jgi:hypothetical protein
MVLRRTSRAFFPQLQVPQQPFEQPAAQEAALPWPQAVHALVAQQLLSHLEPSLQPQASLQQQPFT